MTKQLKCSDIMPNCDFTARAETEEEVMRMATKHAAEKHGIKEVTPDLAKKVRGAIRSV